LGYVQFNVCIVFVCHMPAGGACDDENDVQPSCELDESKKGELK